MNPFERLLRSTRSLLLLLIVASAALSLVRQASVHSAAGFDVFLGAGLIVFVVVTLLRRVKRVSRRSRRPQPTRPELPSKSQWVGPRTRDQEERRT